MSKSSKKAFTLIELLVVISIISLFSSVVTASVSQARIKAQVSRAKQEIRQVINAVVVARDESDKLLWEINGESYGSACSTDCLPACNGVDLRGIGNDCYTKWLDILNGIEIGSGGVFPNLDAFARDVWGSPYLVDENEGVSGQWCTLDFIRSPGPDGIRANGDDVVSFVPFSSMGKIFPAPDLPIPANPLFYTYIQGRTCTCTAPGGACI